MAAIDARSAGAPVDRALLLARIRGEYLEMPGLKLTSAQARRLWGLDASECDSLLEQLVRLRFLTRAPDGGYRRTS